MARRKSLYEIKRLLKRRIADEGSTTAIGVADELREFALTMRFFAGYSMEQIATHEDIAKAVSRDQIERIVRRNSQRRQ